MECPKCHSDKKIKAGIVNKRQRYKCKSCSFYYTVAFKAGITPKLKRLALVMYLQGLGPNHISKALGVSSATVLNWIKAFGLNAGELPSVRQDVKQVAPDEMHTYISSRRSKGGAGMMLISWEEGGYKVLLTTDASTDEECKAAPC